MSEERYRRLEFNTSGITLLNSLEQMGYRVVSSGAFVASQTNNNTKVVFYFYSDDSTIPLSFEHILVFVLYFLRNIRRDPKH